jgi:hypothetical protein
VAKVVHIGFKYGAASQGRIRSSIGCAHSGKWRSGELEVDFDGVDVDTFSADELSECLSESQVPVFSVFVRNCTRQSQLQCTYSRKC